MTGKLKDQAIDIINRVPWGTHISLLYENSNELPDIAVPFLLYGLQNNEYCVWITSEALNSDAAIECLKRSTDITDTGIQEGGLEIIPYTEWFFRDGIISIAEGIKHRDMKYRKAMEEGYRGTKIICDTSWLDKEDRASFIEYVRQQTDTIDRQITMCGYLIGTCDPVDIIDIANSHHYSIIKRNGKWDIAQRNVHNGVEATLEKRMKELRCLFDVTSISAVPHLALNKRFEEITRLLPGAFNYPERTCAQVTLNGNKFRTGNYNENGRKLSIDIVVHKKKAGTVEVRYLPINSDKEDGHFLKEEKMLLEAVAERLGAIIEHREAEESLHESQEMFSKAFHAIPEMITLARIEDGTLIEMNEGFTNLTGFSREEMIGRSAFELDVWIRAEDRNRMIHMLEKDGRVRNAEFQFCTKSGDIRDVELSAEKITVNGEACVLVVSTDITERKLSAKALAESQEMFSKAFRASPSIFSITTLKDGRFIDVNDGFTDFTGYSRDEVIGRSSVETGNWIRPEERHKMIEILVNGGSVRNMEVESVTKSGELRSGLLSAELINIGNEQCVIALLTDITAQKQSEEILRTVSSDSPLAIYIVQDDGLQYTNPQLQQLTGYSEEELKGRDLLDFVSVEDIDVVKSSTVFTLQEDSPYPCEYRILNRTGQIKWVMQTVSPIYYNGKVALLGNLMDITERKYLERKVIEYEELSKMKSDLLATVSHELRTPLATIKGYSTMILDYFPKLNAREKREYLKSIDNSTDRLAKLVDNLLDTSRMEAGLLKLEKVPTSMVKLINRISAEASMRTERHNLVVNVARRLPRINIDAKRIGQVLDNLIDNAIKYSPADTEISIYVRQTGREILVSITDQGSGIPIEELTNIFDRMYRIEQRLSSGKEGIGLGLYICQRLIEAHNGRIWAESKIGEGSTINFTLPVARKTGRKKVV